MIFGAAGSSLPSSAEFQATRKIKRLGYNTESNGIGTSALILKPNRCRNMTITYETLAPMPAFTAKLATPVGCLLTQTNMSLTHCPVECLFLWLATRHGSCEASATVPKVAEILTVVGPPNNGSQ
jgi:hypothetical protein